MESTDGGIFPAVEFQCTKDDFAAAYHLGYSIPRRGLWYSILIILWIVAFFTSFINGTSLWYQLPLPAWVVLAAALCVLALRPFALRWIGRRTYARNPLAQLSRKIELRPEGLRYQSPRGDVTILWRDFIKWRANSKTTLLYTAPGMFVLIPARLAALGFPIDDLKAALTRELGPPVR
ncbi:MAG: YcxB family protein [Bradyrhizobiaceae bacterium]|nr:YcxB family protein [Bradyrhizobiaceae bacterium]